MPVDRRKNRLRRVAQCTSTRGLHNIIRVMYKCWISAREKAGPRGGGRGVQCCNNIIISRAYVAPGLVDFKHETILEYHYVVPFERNQNRVQCAPHACSRKATKKRNVLLRTVLCVHIYTARTVCKRVCATHVSGNKTQVRWKKSFLSRFPIRSSELSPI